MDENLVEVTVDYNIISAPSAIELAKAVSTQLKKKENLWEPYERPFTSNKQDGTLEFHQTMVIIDEEEITD